MDIKITHSLLSTFLKTNATPEQIAEKLSLCGPTVDRLTKLESNDWLYEIEVITNRVDAASAFGIAREAVAILPEFGFTASLINDPRTQTAPKLPTNKPVEISLDKNLAPHFACIALHHVNIKPSPKTTLKQLELCGERGINNVIDISNELTLMYGQPVHVFDLDRIHGKQMKLRLSKKGEIIQTLDNQTHILPGNDIIIEDGDGRIIDLCGIMGGGLSSITPDTKNILLFVQTYDPKHIRKTSLALQKRTLAAQLFEKSPDTEMVVPVLLEGIKLLQQRANAQIASTIIDLRTKEFVPKTISLSLDWLNRFAGINLKPNQISNILNHLEIKNTLKNNVLSCTIPSHRHQDINIKEDLAEEIMRVYGYFRLPSIIPQTDLPKITTHPALTLETKIKQILVNLGATEIYNYSLVSAKMIDQSQDNAFKLSNPLSEDFLYMRQRLFPSLMEARKNNKGSFDKPYVLFEIANVYTKSSKHDLANEIPHLCLLWNMTSYRQAKGFTESLSQKLNLPPQTIIPQPVEDTYGVEVDLNQLVKHASLIHKFQPIPTTQAIIEDLTFTITNQSYADIEKAIKSVSPLIESVDLKDIYQHNYTFTLTYRHPEKTLSNQDVSPIRRSIVSTLEKLNLKLVGSLSE